MIFHIEGHSNIQSFLNMMNIVGSGSLWNSINNEPEEEEVNGNEETAKALSADVARSILKVKDMPELAEYFKMIRLGQWFLNFFAIVQF